MEQLRYFVLGLSHVGNNDPLRRNLSSIVSTTGTRKEGCQIRAAEKILSLCAIVG